MQGIYFLQTYMRYRHIMPSTKIKPCTWFQFSKDKT